MISIIFLGIFFLTSIFIIDGSLYIISGTSYLTATNVYKIANAAPKISNITATLDSIPMIRFNENPSHLDWSSYNSYISFYLMLLIVALLIPGFRTKIISWVTNLVEYFLKRLLISNIYFFTDKSVPKKTDIIGNHIKDKSSDPIRLGFQEHTLFRFKSKESYPASIPRNAESESNFERVSQILAEKRVPVSKMNSYYNVQTVYEYFSLPSEKLKISQPVEISDVTDKRFDYSLLMSSQ